MQQMTDFREKMQVDYLLSFLRLSLDDPAKVRLVLLSLPSILL
jgi:hypothetical protein